MKTLLKCICFAIFDLERLSLCSNAVRLERVCAGFLSADSMAPVSQQYNTNTN